MYPSSVLRTSRLLLLAVTASALSSCAETALETQVAIPVPNLTDAPFSGEVIIRDEEWIDRTIEETPVPLYGEPEAPVEAPSAMLLSQATALGPEPRIRVGVIYQDLGAQMIRVGGQTDSDPFVLRDENAAGPELARSAGGEVVATRVVLSGVSHIRLTLPGGAVHVTPRPVALVSESGIVRIRRFLSDKSLFRGTAEVGFRSGKTALVGINELPIEQYLYGVVPRELGPIAFPYVEAQKTQAIAARTSPAGGCSSAEWRGAAMATM